MPVIRSLPKDTAAEAMWDTIAKAALSRIKRYPGPWEGVELKMTATIGSYESQLLLEEHHGCNLGKIPTGAQENLICKVYLSKELVEYENIIVLRTENIEEEARMNHIQGTDQQDVRASMEEHIQGSTQQRTPRNEDTEMRDGSQAIRRPQNSNLLVEFRVNFVGLDWSRVKPIYLDRSTDFQELTSLCEREVTQLIQPDWLECLLIYFTLIGTERSGYEHPQKGKTLSDYSRSADHKLNLKITAGLMRPTITNLKQKNPGVFSQLPPARQFNELMKDLAASAGVLENTGIAQQGATREKTDRQESQEALLNAQLYGCLVNGIRQTAVQV